MRKSNNLAKKLLVIGLAVVLLAVCVSSPTFSWFNRPESATGGSVSLSVPYGDTAPGTSSPALSMMGYDGSNVSMVHYISTDDGLSFSDQEGGSGPVNPQNQIPAAGIGTQEGSNRVYFKTVLTNSNTFAQNVSMYIRNFKPGTTGTTCVGVNQPIKSFKNYSNYDNPKASAVKSTANGPTTKRIYYEVYSSNGTNWYSSSAAPQVCWGTATTDMGNNGSNANWIPLTWMKDGTNTKMYYADLPSNANQLFFTTGSNWGGNSYNRSQNFTNLTGDGLSRTKSLLFKHSGNYDSTAYNNAQFTVEQTNGVYCLEYYKTATLATGDKIDLGLVTGTQYGGSTISYSCTSGATINSSTGVLTAGSSAATPTVTYTITSQHGDKMTFTCTVSIKAYSSSNKTFPNAPIVTNLLIPGTSANVNANDKNNIVEVYWFIQNGDDLYGTASANAKPSFTNVYLGL